MKIKQIIARCMLSSPLVLMAACGSDEGASNLSGVQSASNLTLNITDGPVDSATAVVVEFTGVSIKSADSEEPTLIQFDEPKSIDLLGLQGSAYETLLSEIALEAGEYEWVRLFVNAEIDGVMDSYIESADGTMKELYIPSGSESGLKVKIKLDLVEGEESNYTIDFDLRRSLHVEGDDAGVKLRPSLRMVNTKESGSVDGLVSDALISEACADGVVGAIYAYEGKDVVPTDYSGAEGGPIASALVHDTDEGYQYELGFLEKGAYTLAYTCDAALDTVDAEETLTFLNTISIDLQGRKGHHLDMTAQGEEGRNHEHADGENYRGFDKNSWGRNRGYQGGGQFADQALTEEEKAAKEAERAAKQAEWDALTDEEKAAMQAEREANEGGFGNDGRGMSEEDRAAKQAEWDALTDEEKAAMQAEREANEGDFLNGGRGLSDEERAAKQAEWDALTEEEKAAKKAEMDAKKAAEYGDDSDDSENDDDDSVVDDADVDVDVVDAPASV